MNPPEVAATSTQIPDVRRIVVLRGGGLGDLVFALPALEALRAAYPDAAITLVGEAWQAELLRGRGVVDDHVAMPAPVLAWLRSSGESGWASVAPFAEAIAGTSPDLAIQLHGGGLTSNPLVTAFGARKSVGSRAPGAATLDRTVPYVYYQSEVMRLLEVAALAGASPRSITPRLPVTDHDRELARDAGVPMDVPVAVLHTGAGDPRRRWPATSFAQVAQRLIDAGATVAMVGGAGDVTTTSAVLSSVPRDAAARVVDLAGALSLPALCGALSRAAVVVGNDSGPLHLAAAVGAPTVGIFWCGNLINAGPPWRTRHRPAISWRLDCPVCGLDCTHGRCDHDASFVADVPAEEVAGSALELLARSRRPGAHGRDTASATSSDGAREPVGAFERSFG